MHNLACERRFCSRSRLIHTLGRISERPPRGGLSVCASTVMLQCMSLLLALSCRADSSPSCPLLGAQLPRGSMLAAAANDPKQTLANVGLESALGSKIASPYADLRRKRTSCYRSNVSDYRNERQGIHG